MKHTPTSKIALAVLALSSAPLMAQTTTTWYHSGVDNSALVGVTPDVTVNLGSAWQDTFLSQSLNGAVQGGWGATQANPVADFFGDGTFLSEDQRWQIWSFGNLNIAPTDVIESATLWVSARDNLSGGSFPVNQTNTWTLFGYTGVMDETTMTWNNSLSGVNTTTSYGTFDITGGNFGEVPGFTGIDITSAILAYNAGQITGIVIGSLDPVIGSFNGNDRAVVFDTSNQAVLDYRPGLEIVTSPIPEPSVALLGALGVFAIFRRRR